MVPRISSKEAKAMYDAYHKVYAPKEAQAMKDAYAKMYAPKEEPKPETEAATDTPAEEESDK